MGQLCSVILITLGR